MGRLDGKVALVTGGARGQGRSHAVTLAREGADIVVCDLVGQIDTVPYPMSNPDDLAETVRLVEELDRRCVAQEADVRSLSQMEAVAEQAVTELGKIDILLANAGIFSLSESTWELTEQQWQDTIDVNLTGVWHACRAVVPSMIAAGNGGAIVITSSTAGIKGIGGAAHYVASKHGVVGLMRTLAVELAPHMIRVNTVHPTGVNTPMINNEAIGEWFSRDPSAAAALANLLPVEQVEPFDISNAILWLVSDEARYVTGVTLPVDAGWTQK